MTVLRQNVALTACSGHLLIWHNCCMRRLLAITLIFLFVEPFVVPLFGERAVEATLPACCRRNGKHHCMMFMTWSRARKVTAVGEKCPYDVAPPAVMVLPHFTPSVPASIFAGIHRHPSVVAQTEAQWRISFDRTRQKRGPPAQVA